MTLLVGMLAHEDELLGPQLDEHVEVKVEAGGVRIVGIIPAFLLGLSGCGSSALPEDRSGVNVVLGGVRVELDEREERGRERVEIR